MKYWWSFWIIATLGLLGAVLEPYLGYRAIGFIFLLGVLAVGFFNSLGPVLFSAFVSAIAWNFFFIPPRFTFTIASPDDLFLCLSFFAAAVITGILTSRALANESKALESEAETTFLYEILQDILQSAQPKEFLGRIEMRINEFTGGDPVLEVHDHKAHIKFRKPIELKHEQKILLASAEKQITLALERYAMEAKLREADKLKESEQLHQTLLNSISHELRTPLTALVGFASALNDESVPTSKEMRREVAKGVSQACDRLNRVIGNLLDMSRLNSGALALNREWHDVHDLIGVVLQGLKEALSEHPVDVKVEENVPLVEMDFRLMEHALSNLVINAASYSPPGSPISIRASREGGHLQVGVRDQGPGVPEQSMTKIFEKFYRIPGTPPGGTGLGLSIVKEIVSIHNGQVQVRNSHDGHGAEFEIRLPLGIPPASPQEATRG